MNTMSLLRKILSVSCLLALLIFQSCRKTCTSTQIASVEFTDYAKSFHTYNVGDILRFVDTAIQDTLEFVIRLDSNRIELCAKQTCTPIDPYAKRGCDYTSAPNFYFSAFDEDAGFSLHMRGGVETKEDESTDFYEWIDFGFGKDVPVFAGLVLSNNFQEEPWPVANTYIENEVELLVNVQVGSTLLDTVYSQAAVGPKFLFAKPYGFVQLEYEGNNYVLQGL